MVANPIKYLMIGEAAPETLSGEVSYFYNNCRGNWCKALVEGIIPRQQVPVDTRQKFEELAQRQFLLADIMPFAINYSVANRRGKKHIKNWLKCVPIVIYVKSCSIQDSNGLMRLR